MKRKKSFILQAGILASAGLITKIIGFIYRIPMANILGNTGNGIYSVAFGIYSIVLTLSSYSMPISISKIISEKRIVEDETEIKKILYTSIIISIIIGAVAAGALFFSADFLAILYNKDGLQIPLKVLACTTFVVAILGCYRGYFQGYGNMVPTAFSQIIEQTINAVVSIIAAGQITFLFTGTQNDTALKVVGGTLGTLAGAVTAFIFILIFYRKKNRREFFLIKQLSFPDIKIITKSLVKLMIPIILSQTVYQIGYTIDDYIFAKEMIKKGFDETFVTDIQGVFNTQYTQMINLPIGIATAFGVSIIPRITSSFIKKEKKEIDDNIIQLTKITTLVIFPATIGLSICSKEIMNVLFPQLGSLHSLAAKLLLYGSIATVFYSFSTISISILQGCNYFKIPVINAAISLLIHIVVVILLVNKTNLQAYSLLIGDIIFPMLILIFNTIFIKKKINPKIYISRILLKPFIGAALMGGAIVLFKLIVDKLDISNIVALTVEVIIGIVVYGLYIYLIGYFNSYKEVD